MGMQEPYAFEQLAACRAREPLTREDQGNLLSGIRDLFEDCERLIGRLATNDAVAAPVAVVQLSFGRPQGRQNQGRPLRPQGLSCEARELSCYLPPPCHSWVRSGELRSYPGGGPHGPPSPAPWYPSP